MAMASEYTKILKYNQNRKSDKATVTIYVNLDGCKNNPKKLSTTKLSEHSITFFNACNITL